MTTENNSDYSRLEDQIAWYDSKSLSSQRRYKISKVISIVCAASVPVVVNYNTLLASILGAIIIIIESIQQLGQWHANWISYRATCEALRHEKYCYMEKAGPYDNLENTQAKVLLVERVEALISTEHSKWSKIVSKCGAEPERKVGKQ